MDEIEDMPYDAELLGRVLDDHDVPAKRLAHAAGLHSATIYRYLSGEKTLPSTVLRAAFELTHDSRLVNLITGNVPVAYQIVGSAEGGAVGTGRPLRVPPIAQIDDHASEAVENAAKCMRYILAILKDGRVDASDRTAGESFKKHEAAAVLHFALVRAAFDRHLAKGSVA